MPIPVTCARRWLVPALLIFVLALTACAQPVPTPAVQANLGGLQAADAPATLTSVPTTPTATPTATLTPTATPTPTPVVELEAADAFFNREVAADRFSGAVLVAQRGRILLKKGYGYADRERKLPNTPQTRFHIGSLTKQFTALAILHLQEAGKLRVTDPISTYLPDCPPIWRDITIEHLLTHTSGLMDYFYLPGLDDILTQSVTPDKIVDIFRDRPLLFKAGSRHSYSNSGYVLLGQIIERVSGESYGNRIQKGILAPLNMAATTYGSDGPPGACAVGYEIAWRRAPDADLSVGYAAGGLCSTVEDLYRWDQALYTTKMCSQSSLEAFLSPHVPLGEKVWAGYGWFIREIGGHRRISHTGLLYGYSGIIARFPDDKVTIIILSNLENAPVSDYVDVLADLIFADS